MKSFLSGRPQASVTPLSSLTAPTAKEGIVRVASHTHPAGKNDAVPQIECIKEGDKVARIIVTCGCGERIEIECLYPGGG